MEFIYKAGVLIYKAAVRIFIGIILAVIIWVLFCLLMSVRCYFFTDVPDDLTAEQTLEKYFEYWDNGNLYGAAILWEDTLPDKYNSFGSGSFMDSIKLHEYEYIGTYKTMDKQGYDTKVFRTEYSKTFDDGWQGMTAGMNYAEYVLYRKDENSPWRLCATGCCYTYGE